MSKNLESSVSMGHVWTPLFSQLPFTAAMAPHFALNQNWDIQEVRVLLPFKFTCSFVGSYLVGLEG